MNRTNDSLLSYLNALSDGGNSGFLRDALETLTQMVMEMEVSAAIEASPYERKRGRRSYRNGYRERSWQTGLGEISLRIPKLRKGTYYPSFIEDWPEVERALLGLIEAAFVQGANFRSAEDALRHIGISPAHGSQIAELCDRLDEMIDGFRRRALDSSFPALLVEVLEIRRGGGRADVVAAIGVREDGGREMLDFEVTRYAEGRAFWADFLNGMRRRGLRDVERVISAPYEGLKPALRETLPGVNWIERDERQPLVVAYAPALAGSPGLWVDSSRPNKHNQIVSSLGGLSGAMEAVYASPFSEADWMTMTRVVGLLLMGIHTSWQGETMLATA